MQLLTVLGTLAMFLVGGGILAHGLPGMHDVVHHLVESVATLPTVGAGLAWAAPAVLDAVLGVLAGALALAVVTLGGKLFKARLSAAWRLYKKPARPDCSGRAGFVG